MRHIVDFLDAILYGDRIRATAIHKVVPEGWQELVDQAFGLIDLMPDSQITRISAEKGLLRIVGECKLEQNQVIFDKFAQALARDSATMCMKCGKRGFRRKEEEGWPALCGVHYVEYVNFLDSYNKD